jgi:hypothetical protein
MEYQRKGKRIAAREECTKYLEEMLGPIAKDADFVWRNRDANDIKEFVRKVVEGVVLPDEENTHHLGIVFVDDNLRVSLRFLPARGGNTGMAATRGQWALYADTKAPPHQQEKAILGSFAMGHRHWGYDRNSQANRAFAALGARYGISNRWLELWLETENTDLLVSAVRISPTLMNLDFFMDMLTLTGSPFVDRPHRLLELRRILPRTQFWQKSTPGTIPDFELYFRRVARELYKLRLGKAVDSLCE